MVVIARQNRPSSSAFGDGRRVASLRARELGAYLSRTFRFGPAVVGVIAAATWISTRIVDESTLSHFETRPTPGEVGAGVGVASVRHLAAMGCIVALFNLTGAVANFHGTTYGRRDTFTLALMAIIIGLAWVAWFARAWGPAVPPARPGPVEAAQRSSQAGRPTTPRTPA